MFCRSAFAGHVVVVAAALSLAGCAAEDGDVRPTIVAASLAVDGQGLRGTIHGRYENTSDAAATIQKPELQLVSAERVVGGVELVFPKGFDPHFDAGRTEDLTFAVDDDGVWTDFCGAPVELELQHQTVVPGGKIIVSDGAGTDVRLTCPTR